MNSIQKNLLKTALKMLGVENVSKQINEILQHLIDKKKDIKLQNGETDIIIMLYEINNIAYIAQAGITEFNGEILITRYITVNKIIDFLEKYINEIEK